MNVKLEVDAERGLKQYGNEDEVGGRSMRRREECATAMLVSEEVSAQCQDNAGRLSMIKHTAFIALRAIRTYL